jgi:hypothetical protein
MISTNLQLASSSYRSGAARSAQKIETAAPPK